MAVGADDADVAEEARVQRVRSGSVARTNVYSRRWRETFGAVDPDRTRHEVEFLRRVLPFPEFRWVLDVPCGTGRHMSGLSALGYAVRGVDRDAAVVAEARRRGLDVVVGDMRDLSSLRADFDAVVCMWASFGYFDPKTNREVLRQLVGRVRAGGRVVLDVFDRRFIETHQGERDLGGVLERKQVRDGRLLTELVYEDGTTDTFEWQLSDRAELEALGRAAGIRLVLSASAFDENDEPAGHAPRMQLVFER